MATNVTMQYGSYTFSPVPLISFSRELISNENGEPLYIQYSAEISGKLLSIPGGVATIFELQNDLQDAFDCEQCKLFEIKCDEATLFSVRPDHVSLSFAEGNWIQKCDYTISLKWVDSSDNNCTNPPYVRDTQNEWSLEPIPEPAILAYYPSFTGCNTEQSRYLFNLTHNVSAVGVPYCDASGVRHSAWEQARDWVVDNLGLDTSVIAMTGVFNNSGTYGAYDHFRQATQNETAGSYSVTESWVITRSTNPFLLPAKESFTVEISEDNTNGLTNVVVSGTIVGFEEIDYSTGTINTTKYDNAVLYWNGIKGNLLCRAQYANTNECSLNMEPISSSVGHNPTSGTLTYSYVYNNRPSRIIPGSRAESISFSYQNPTDVFAEHIILGRVRGPLFQSLGTVTRSCQTVNIELTMSGCTDSSSCANLFESPKSTVEQNVLCCIEGSLTGVYNQVFKTDDTDSWDPITRRYSRSITWCYQNCTGEGDSTSLCQ